MNLKSSRDPGTALPLGLEQGPRRHLSFTRVDLISLIIIASAAMALLLPLFLSRFPDGVDAKYHYRWSYYFCEALREGTLYPRWLAGASRGYGSPTMFYYPPLPFYVVAGFNLIAPNLLLAIKLSCALSMVLSGVTMYFFSRTMLARPGSLVAAVTYMLAPYHIFELCRVGALSEFWSFVWIPLVFDAVRRLAGGEGWRASAYLALSYALLIFTHVPTSLIVALILPVYLLVLTRDKGALVKGAGGIALGVGLSAIFFVSVLFETRYVRIDHVLSRMRKKTFLFEDFSAISWTNLLSAADYHYPEGNLKEANLVAISLALLFVVASLILWVRRKSVELNLAPQARSLWLVALISLLMTTRLTEILWSSIRPLQYLDKPVRWLVPATAATFLLTAIAASAVSRTRERRVLYAVPLILAIAFNLAISAHVATQEAVEPGELEEELGSKDVREYSPIWWNEQFHRELEDFPLVVNNGQAMVLAIDDAGLKQSYQVTAATPATLRFRSLYFPGWVARIDGSRVDVQRSTEGNIQIGVEPGEHNITLRFELTWTHITARTVSAVSILILAAMFYSNRLRNKKAGPRRRIA
ncbi:MAG TPA: 6-pyruvoyl-tetrahydropterin synthase-related protein [Blastocatellia bacterium]|nr:6-pyruvoyl-tetrahydropterin synthase-related protein [Blastocatellia bacterium]